MHQLLADAQYTHGPDQPRILDLRRGIGIVQLQGWQYKQAICVLYPLVSSFNRAYSPSPSKTARVRALLE